MVEISTPLLVMGIVVLAIFFISYFIKSKRLSKFDNDKDINKREAFLLLQQWKVMHEAEIRADAIKRSNAVVKGKVTEHLISFIPGFAYNPKDVRFIGSPIDLIIFDGHADEKDEITIYIVEVKTGKSRPTIRQKKIRDAVLNGRVHWWETGNDI